MVSSIVRNPVVSGQFYPNSANEIKKQLNSFIAAPGQIYEAIGCLMPHAGYIYSGKVATLTAASMHIKETVFLLGPNHTGYGSPFSIMAKGSWKTPMGDVEIDDAISNKLLENCNLLTDDASAHMFEHSLEVELPILQFFNKNFKIIPITMSSDDINELKKVGEAIAGCIKSSGAEQKSLIIASSDLTHYEDIDSARKKDNIAIDSILKLDENGLMKNIKEYGISMCGYMPAITMISAAKLLNAKKTKLISYTTSAENSGDESSVVGYAGIVIY
ncbi:MAG: AmmeMemoRadiSam system protein B [Candidatus Omnitrophota bacterium]|jgi:AmmeMemoRadiSam system protein B|nr:MAG: AmmeMemoRadiSam system protein B [Candidatus Omnitrophota bacterium]